MAERKQHPIQKRIRKFSRVEKAFYGSIILTAIILAVSIVFMQTKLLQVNRDLTEVNAQIESEQAELDNIKQEVNELTRYERLSQLASSQDMKLQKGNRKTVSTTNE
ncbi:cell division protein FtsL [Streptococcus cristatus]|uniref:cell division protein FtsL n=1 Tax=Streptococcus cristatus TaxID=45634 RepID=UPI001EF2F285|nr:cell division protein FtsL [Streptococcus cristatus]MCG7329806.1 cell division protein FtsL [Streptococcus cristatus]